MAMTSLAEDTRGIRDWPSYFEEIETQGFTVVPNVVDPAECSSLRNEILQALRDDWKDYQGLPGKQEFICLDLVTRSPAFVRLLENEVMHRVFAHFLSETCILYSNTSTVLRPSEKHFTSQIHTDMPARLVEGYHLGLLMTLACDDFTHENGATYYLAGSQNRWEAPSEKEFYANAVRVTRKAGDAVFFNPRVWHAGGVNGTTRDRVGCTIFACRSWMKQRFDYPRMVGEEVLALLGERGRGFLGFNTRVPTNMREYYLPAEDRLYKPGQG